MLEEATARYCALVEGAFPRLFSRPTIPPSLREAMCYSLNAGGKRLRPCLVLAAAELCGGDLAQALPLACGVEMIHTYSLIHDDLPCMDDDDFRRGKPSNHKVFGESTAVLAGDGLLSFAFETMLEGAAAGGPGYLSALEEIARGAGVSGMVAGQVEDLSSQEGGEASFERLRSIHRLKTGALIRSSVLAGAKCAGAGEDCLLSLSAFAEAFGVLFQITDDILDVEGDFALMGKTLGKDREQHKLTYVTFLGLEEAKRAARETAKAALAALNGLGAGAEYFRELAQSTLFRRR